MHKNKKASRFSEAFCGLDSNPLGIAET